MTIRHSGAIALTLLIFAVGVHAQERLPGEPAPAAGAPQASKPPPPPPKKPETLEPPPAPRQPGQPVNVRIDVTIADQRGSAPPTKKTVTLLLADGENGSVRSTSQVPVSKGSDNVMHLPLEVLRLPLDIDASPRLLDGQKVRLVLTLNIQLQDPRSEATSVTLSTQVVERVTVILESGRPMVVAQSADPVTDRQVTVEAKATILR